MVSWVVGAVINVFGSILINAGTNIMKLGHNKRQSLELNGGTAPPIRKIRSWQLGVSLFIVGNLANFGSFAFAAQSLLAALGSVQFVANVVFGRFILHEQITKRILVSTALIVAGCIVLVSFGNHTSETYTTKQLLSFYKADGYIAYLCVMAFSVAFFWALFRHGNALRKRKGQSMETVSKAWQRVLPVSYSIFSALLGTQSVLFSKALSLLLRTTISGNNQLSSWFTWLNLILFILAAAFWVTRLNMALKLFPAAVIVPTMQIFWTLCSIIAGLVYYQEFKGLTALKAAMFAVGVVIVFVGVFILTSRNTPADTAYIDLQEELVKSDGPDSAAAAAGNSRVDATSASHQGGQSAEDDESFPLSPTRAEQRANISRRSPQAAAGSSEVVHPQLQRQTHQRRDSSLFEDLTVDFNVALMDAGRQMFDVAQHPVPPYALPLTAKSMSAAKTSRAPQDIELGRQSAAAAAATEQTPSRARSPVKPPPTADRFAGNPFAGGLAAEDSLARQQSGGFVTPAPLQQRPSMASSDGAADALPDRSSIFGSRRILSDDDETSPTWAMTDNASSRRVSEANTGGVKALLGVLSPRLSSVRRQKTFDDSIAD